MLSGVFSNEVAYLKLIVVKNTFTEFVPNITFQFSDRLKHFVMVVKFSGHKVTTFMWVNNFDAIVVYLQGSKILKS